MNTQLRATDIKLIRERLAMTQQEFAVYLGVTVVTVNRWETGDYNPSPMALVLLDKALQDSLRKLKAARK
jgi:DNA-binding transcriptional regulator YiaG